MESFWNKTTLVISILAIIFPIIIIYFNYIYSIEGWGIANAITLCAVFITILSTLYSNFKSDERVNKQIKTSEEQFKKQLEQNEKNIKEQLIFDKKHDTYINLYLDLDKYWGFLDDERINYYEKKFGEPVESEITEETFTKIHMIILKYKSGPSFNYMSSEIQDTIKDFIEYIDNNLENYDYYQYTQEEFWKALTILSKIYPLLKKEIGFN